MKVNGVTKEWAASLTVTELLEQEGFQRERVAVEVNEEIVPKDAYGTTVLSDADVVEVVSFMGGGSR